MTKGFTFEHQENGACLITPFVATDGRGEFVKDFNSETLKANGIDFTIHEVLNVISKKGVVRGLHFQKKNCQAKLLRCLKGRIVDIIVDLRDDTDTFGSYWSYELDGDKKQSLFVPHGFAHGYMVLEDDTYVQYFCDDIYNGEFDGGINYNEVEWPWERIGGKDNAIVSDKDVSLPYLEELIRKSSEEKSPKFEHFRI